MIGEYAGERRTLYPKSCQFCGKEFFIPKKSLKKAKFCSKDCCNKNRAIPVKTNCSYCCKAIIRSPSKMKRAKHGLVFCDRICKESALKDSNFTQKKPGNYKDGSRGYYRNRAFEIYGKSCKKCGYKDHAKMLDVHHIDFNRKNGAIENLVVLCVWCHALITRKVEEF